MIKQITFLVGLNDKDSKVQEVDTLDAYKVVANIVATGCTIRECRGVYEHEDGTIVFETSLEVLVLDFDGTLNDEWVQNKVMAIKTALNQESVVVQYTEVNSELR